MNKFGGDWTNQKIDIITSYAKAYLTVMKDRPYFKLIYFDGFAGSGEITAENKDNIEGAALRIIGNISLSGMLACALLTPDQGGFKTHIIWNSASFAECRISG